MVNYLQMKKRLKNVGCKVTYFTPNFYETFIESFRRHNFESVLKTDFYQKNSCDYCEFLSCFYDEDNLIKYEAIYTDSYENVIDRFIDYAEDEKMFIALAEKHKPVNAYMSIRNKSCERFKRI